MRRVLLTVAIASGLVLAGGSPAHACSRDDQAYFDSFPDATCLLTQSGTEVDTLGGLRLVTDGEVVPEAWDTQAQFETAQQSSLAIEGGAAPGDPAAVLALPPTALPLDPAGAVLSAAEAAAPDNDDVDDPAVVRTPDGYVMYYTGTPEDGGDPQILRATSPDGRVWTRGGVAGAPQVVLSGGGDGAFDEHGVFGAEVHHDPADAEAPFRMWFSGRGDVFTQIGYATSSDGITWTKRTDPVVPVGLPGSRDSFVAAQPDVIRDGGLWKMWYEGDDSTKKSIAYATSTDGLAWSKGGTVISPEDGGGNTEFGVFAPTVFKTGETFRMLLGGRKQTNTVFQTKLIEATSADGVSWTLGSIGLNPGNGFDASNLNSPEVLHDPADAAAAYKLYYSGDAVDADGDPHTRIGMSQTSGGTGWQGGKLAAAVLDISPAEVRFDARSAAELSMADGGGGDLTGAYAGRRTDDRPRLGLVSSADGVQLAPLATAGQLPDGSALELGTGNQFDAAGHDEPSLLHEADGSGTDDWFVYFTGHATGGARTIGVSATTEVPETLQPAGPWSNSDQVLTAGATFDATAVSHPSVIRDGATYVMYYTGHDGSVTKIGRATAPGPTDDFANRAEIVLTGAATCDPGGALDPVVVKLGGGDYRMLYTGRFGGDRERACYATSADGVTWTRAGTVLNPSLAPFAYDEEAVSPSGLLADGSVLRAYLTGTDRFGRVRSGAASTPLPTPDTPQPAVPSGWATYQFGDAASPPQDFRSIQQVSSGTGTEVWMSVLQPYAGDNWSAFFPVLTEAGTAELNFDLRVTGVRIQVRQSGPAGDPRLDRLVLDHAPVRFAAAGEAVTADIAPPDGFALSSWTSMTIDSELLSYGAGTASGTVSVLDAGDGSEVVAPTALTPGETVVPLGGVDASQHPKLRVRLALSSSHEQTTTLVNDLRVSYAALEPGATPTPTPTPLPETPVLTLEARPSTVVFGRPARLTGLLVQGDARLGGAAVTLTHQPRGASAFAPLASTLTGVDGTYSQTVKPRKRTTYAAAADGATTPPPVTVEVKHRVTLKVRLRGRKATFKGAVGPRHARRVVRIQRKKGARWAPFAKVRTNKRSRFAKAARLKKGRYRFRAVTAADADHLAGRSPARKVRVR